MAYDGLPGLSLAVVVDQEILWARGFGLADLATERPATPDTLYRIASITKLFTATAVLQLRDAGKLQLDDPVADHLPWFNIADTYPEDPPVTLRHLLTHTSGLPREPAFSHWMTAEFPSLAQIQAQLATLKTIIPRDTKLKYSNLALALAGEIVAEVSGQSYAEYVEQNILAPLGMTDTFVTPVPPEHPRLATGYGRRMPDGSRAVSPYTDAQGLAPAFNMATTVADLARFAMFQLAANRDDDHPVLHGRTRLEMRRVHFLDENWQTGWGLGFTMRREEGETVFGHGGAVLGFRTSLSIRAADGLAVIVFTNADDGAPDVVAARAFKWLAPAIKKARETPESVEETDSTWERVAGRYRSAWGDTVVLVYEGQLMMLSPMAPDPLTFVTTLEPVSDLTFRCLQPDFHAGSHGELVHFETDERNRVVSLVDANGNAMTRIDRW
jgi:CubicO group peptidase (beta-lactamase class C family)